MELKFTKENDRSATLSEADAIAFMDERFADGDVVWGRWDNGYSYCGSSPMNGFKDGASVVAYLKKAVAEKYGESPTDYQMCDYSGYGYSGIRCDKEGRFIICMYKNGKGWSEVSDS